MATSVYIHIPFCKSKCKYCSFVSFSDTEKKLGYIYSLLKEIETYYQGENLKTIYFGGGTPSLIEVSLIKKILAKFNYNEDCEITFEINPDDANKDYLKSLYDIGINRLSFGAQTFDNNVLKLIGRRHDSKQIISAVQTAQTEGFKNISLDLIYGLPEANLSNDLKTITELGVQHISTYGLKIEEDSYFYNHLPTNLPDDDAQADMYLQVNETLEKKGYKRYEISNFSLKGFESKHNLNYWNNSEYYGFGVAAHGYIDGIRYSNYTTLEKYLNDPTSHECGHYVSKEEQIEEEIFLGFRKEEGINTALFKEKFDIDFEEKYKKVIEKFSPEYLEKTPLGYKLTLKGVLLSNNILAEFL